MASQHLRQIGGALSQFWASGEGPSRAQIESALLIAGHDGSGEGNKQQLVLGSIANSNDAIAKQIIEELIALLREHGYFERPVSAEAVSRLRRRFDASPHELDHEGYVRWTAGPTQDSVTEDRCPVDAAIRPSRSAAPVREPAYPNIDLLASSLRRLGSGAMRSMIDRRRERPGVTISDEYDLQDAVEVLLRSLYSDVRAEESTPSSASASSRMDFLLREDGVAVEVKAVVRGRAERQVRREILEDVEDYRGHPTVRVLIVAVYDLDGSWKNPAGFEHDLTRRHDGLDVRVVVVPWVGRRS